jgi:hypothetical protein
MSEIAKREVGCMSLLGENPQKSAFTRAGVKAQGLKIQAVKAHIFVLLDF